MFFFVYANFLQEKCRLYAKRRFSSSAVLIFRSAVALACLKWCAAAPHAPRKSRQAFPCQSDTSML